MCKLEAALFSDKNFTRPPVATNYKSVINTIIWCVNYLGQLCRGVYDLLAGNATLLLHSESDLAPSWVCSRSTALPSTSHAYVAFSSPTLWCQVKIWDDQLPCRSSQSRREKILIITTNYLCRRNIKKAAASCWRLTTVRSARRRCSRFSSLVASSCHVEHNCTIFLCCLDDKMERWSMQRSQ